MRANAYVETIEGDGCIEQDIPRGHEVGSHGLTFGRSRKLIEENSSKLLIATGVGAL